MLLNKVMQVSSNMQQHFQDMVDVKAKHSTRYAGKWKE
jgi:hypothetical protein